MRTITTTTLVAATALGIGACGGGGSDKGLSRKDIAAKANAICAKTTKQQKAVPQPTGAQLQDADAAAAYFDKIAPIAMAQTNGLKALKPASDVKADWATFLAAEERGNDLVQTLKRKADGKDQTGLQDLQKLPALAQKVTDAAATIGASDCK